jgi:hypothetical protein
MEAALASNHLSVGTQLKLQYAVRYAQLQLLKWRTLLPLPGDGPVATWKVGFACSPRIASPIGQSVYLVLPTFFTVFTLAFDLPNLWLVQAP